MKINAKKTFLVLLGASTTLFIVSLIVQFGLSGGQHNTLNHITRLFNLNYEISIPTWYSQTQHLLIATIAFILATTGYKNRRYWSVLVLFLFLRRLMRAL